MLVEIANLSKNSSAAEALGIANLFLLVEAWNCPRQGLAAHPHEFAIRPFQACANLIRTFSPWKLESCFLYVRRGITSYQLTILQTTVRHVTDEKY